MPLRDSGIETVMLTGDAEESAKAVAGAVGIQEVHAGLLPQQKLERLQSIRETKGAAMFVGDGINDAPVLAGADVGAAMGSSADAAIEAADVVFMTSDVAAVPQALAFQTDRPDCVAECGVRSGGEAGGHDPRPVRLCLHVAGGDRRFRRGAAVRPEFHSHLI